MGPLEAATAALSGFVGAAAWVKYHRHDDLVPRTEFDLIRQRLDEIREDLRNVQERLDRLAEDR